MTKTLDATAYEGGGDTLLYSQEEVDEEQLFEDELMESIEVDLEAKIGSLASGSKDISEQTQQDEPAMAQRLETGLEPDPSLSQSSQASEQVLLYLLRQPGLSVSRPNVGSFIRHELDISDNQYEYATKTLRANSSLNVTKEPNGRSIDGLELDIGGVIQHLNKGYVTPRVIAAVKTLLEQPNALEQSQDGLSNYSRASLRYKFAQELQAKQEKARRSVSSARLKDSRHSWLNFSFRVNGEHFSVGYPRESFANKDDLIKLMHAIGLASTFKQTDEHYKLYLKNIVNVGKSGETELTEKQINRLLARLNAKGYCENGDSRYKLTSKGHDRLIEDKQAGKKPAEDKKTEVTSIPEGHKTVVIVPRPTKFIRPAELPTVLGELDEDKDLDNQVSVKSLAQQAMCVLAELELAGGSIKFISKNVPSEIQRASNGFVSRDAYKYSIDTLGKKGFVKVSQGGKKVELTKAGRDFIALAKTYHEYMRNEGQPPQKKPKPSSTLKIIEFLADEIGLRLDPNQNLDELPERSDWWKPKGYQEPILPSLAQEVDMSEETASKRLYEMHAVLGYIEVQIINGIMSNACIARKGLEFAITNLRELREHEEVLDEAEVNKTQKLVNQCLDLAEILDRIELVQELKEKYEQSSLFDLKKEAFDQESKAIEELLESLIGEYVDGDYVPNDYQEAIAA